MSDYHQVDCHCAQDDLLVYCVVAAVAEGRAEQALEHGEHGFDLPTLAVNGLREVVQHLAAVLAVDGLGCAVAPRPAARGRWENALDPEFLAAELVGWFAFVAGVAEQRVDRLTLDGGQERGDELDVVGLGSAVDEGRQQQVGFRVADG